MPRSPKCYTLISIVSGVLDYETFTDAEKLKAALSKVDDDKGDRFQLFAGEPVPFKVHRTPTVQIGVRGDRKKADRKPRTRKPVEAKTKGTPVSADFFEKPTADVMPMNGTPATFAPAPSSATEQE